MPSRGVHFALLEKDALRLRRAGTDERRMALIASIEEKWERKWLQETDKAWDAIHRCLTDGELDNGGTPLHRVIFADRNLYDDEDEYYISLVTPKRVAAVVAAIRGIDQAWMRQQYTALGGDYGGYPTSDEDFEYTWSWFAQLRTFFGRAAKAGRWVSFTVSH